MELNLFLIFAILSIISAAMTIAASNPVHSVFYLILTFIGVSALFFLLGVEFLAVIFLIVYVGAVSILFLFVVMMLNIKLVEWSESLTRFVPITLIIGLIFLSQATTLLDNFSNTNLLSTTDSNYWISLQFIDWVRSFINFTNVEMLGQYLYTDFSYLFLLSSMILLVAMIGAIILSLDHHRQIKRQDLYTQVSTKSTVSLKTVRQPLILTRNFHRLSKTISNTPLKLIKRNKGQIPELEENVRAGVSLATMGWNGLKNVYRYFYPNPVQPSIPTNNPVSVPVNNPVSVPVNNPVSGPVEDSVDHQVVVNVTNTISTDSSSTMLLNDILNGAWWGSTTAAAGIALKNLVEILTQQGGRLPEGGRPQIRGSGPLPASLLLASSAAFGAGVAYNRRFPGYILQAQTEAQAMRWKILQSLIKESEKNNSLLQKIEDTYGSNDLLVDLKQKSNQHLLDLCSYQPGQIWPKDPLEYGVGVQIKMEYLATGKVSLFDSVSSTSSTYLEKEDLDELDILDLPLETAGPSGPLETNSQFIISSPLEEPIGNKLPSFSELYDTIANIPLEDLSYNFILMVGVYIGALTIKCLMSIFLLFLIEQFREYLRLHPDSIFFRNQYLATKLLNKWSQRKLDYRLIAFFCITSLLVLSSYHHQLLLLLGYFYNLWKNE